MKNYLPLTLFFLLPFLSFSQPGYLVGTSMASIEPDQSLISLNLTGYGYPREGRFTLQWVNKGPVPEVTALGEINGKLYLVSKGDLLKIKKSGQKEGWERVGKANDIKSIAGINNKLYGLNHKGELLVTDLLGVISWKKLGSVDKSVKVIAASRNKLFAANSKGLVWSAELSKKGLDWIRLSLNNDSINNVVSFTANNSKLYVLTGKGAIYQCDSGKKDSKWLKIAYRNGETFREDMKQITILDGRIYGVSEANFLYLGEHRTEGNLSARAMAIKAEDKTVIIVNVDICGLTDVFTGTIKQEINKKNHIPPSAIFINCTHTHFAPVSQDCLTWQEHSQRPDSIFLNVNVKNGIINAIEGALKEMAPAELSFGRGKSNIGYNRSLPDHPELYDSDVDVIKVEYQEQKRESYLFLAACHPVFSTTGKLLYTISANYPGVARKLLEERTKSSNSLFIQGTAGDIDPKDNGEYITGEKLSNDVIAVLSKPLTKIRGPVSCYLDTINIPVKPWSKEEITAYRAENVDKSGDVYAEKNVKWCDLMIRYYREGTMPSSMPVYIQTINVGNWKLIGFSRETTTGYGLGVKKLWPDKLISVAGYTNDVSSYLPTHMHLAAGVYEGKDSYFWDGMPNAFPQNTDEIILNTIKSLGR